MKTHAKITGVGGYYPQQFSNEDYIKVFGRSAKAVDRIIPYKKRFSAFDLESGTVDITNTEMAYRASTLALARAKINPADIQMIIYSSITPDYLAPPCFTLLQEKLEINECMGFDIRSGCAGFGTAVITAQQFIQSEMASKILVVGSDLISSRHSILFGEGIKNFPAKALYNLMFFGDGAGALVLEATEDPEEGIFGAIMGSTKAAIPCGSTIQIGGSRYPYPSQEVAREYWPISQNGKQTEETLPQVLVDAIDKFLELYDLKLDEFDHYIFPVTAANLKKRIPGSLKDLNNEKVITISTEGGAMINASIPLALEKALKDDRLKRGDKLLIYAGENTKWQHAIVGLTWGALNATQ